MSSHPEDGVRFSDRADPPVTPSRQRIVVGVDGSAESRAALLWALHQAENTDTDVDVVAVSDSRAEFGETVASSAFEDEARRWIDEALPEVNGDHIGLRTWIERGLPAPVLVEHARRADLLVLGNHGRGALAGAVVGSVALRCAHLAPCPVVLVPLPPAAEQAVRG